MGISLPKIFQQFVGYETVPQVGEMDAVAGVEEAWFVWVSSGGFVDVDVVGARFGGDTFGDGVESLEFFGFAEQIVRFACGRAFFGIGTADLEDG